MPDFLNALAQFAPYDTLDSTPFDTGAVQSMGAAQQARPHGFLNTLGQIGDVLATIGNRTPVYSTVNAQRDAQARQQQVQQALAHVNPNDPNSVNALLPLNPELWAKLRSATTPTAENVPNSYREYQLGVKDPRGYGSYLESRQTVPVIGDLEHGLQVAPTYQPYRFSLPQQQTAPSGGSAEGPSVIKQATARGYILPDEVEAVKSQLGPNGQAAMQGWLQQNHVRVVARTGTAPDGRKVLQFDDGTVDYAD